MNAKGAVLVVGLHALIGLAVLFSVTILTALHDSIGATLASLYGVILGLAGAGSAAVSTLGTAVDGKAAIPSQLIQDLLLNQRQTIASLAGARQIVDEATQPGGRRSVDPPPSEHPA